MEKPATGPGRVHESLRLYISSSAYHIVADNAQPQTLSISRASNEISLTEGPLPAHAGYEQVLPIHGILGLISLLESDYLIVITARKRVARILNTDIYQATNFGIYPINAAPKGPAEHVAQVAPEESYLLGLLKASVTSSPFFYTHGPYDLTNRLQKQSDPAGQQVPLYERADDRFFWNKHLMSRFIETTARGSADLSKFILPLVFGFCEIKDVSLNGRPFVFGLISRRSRFRAGTRYFSRGIDREGHVSNFNESEQILLLDHPGSSTATYPPSSSGSNGASVQGQIRYSYVQIRGSVPVYWAEINNLRYKPDLQIMDLADTVESSRRHFDAQVEQYGDVYAVNLVNQKGYEKAVKDAFEKAVATAANPKVHYTYFDFHHECKGLRFDRVQLLIDALQDDLTTQGYFAHDTTSSSRPQHLQTSVVRSNCMDCLDRTNVVQSALASWVLTRQLQEAGVLSPTESVTDHAAFIYIFRNVWADHANAVSNAYSGSGALKTDYTRTGVRTKMGALQDGYNSLLRYVKNNFFDGPRQDAYDLVTGAWVPRAGSSLFLSDKRPAAVRYAPHFLMTAMMTFAFAAVYPSSAYHYFGSLPRLFFGLTLSVTGLCYFVFSHGIDYVAWPRLNSLQDVIMFNGKGHVSGRHGRGPLAYHSSGASGSSLSLNEGSSKGTLQGVGATKDSGLRVTAGMQQRDFKRMSTVELESGQNKKRVD